MIGRIQITNGWSAAAERYTGLIRGDGAGRMQELSFRSVRGFRLGRVGRNWFAFVEAGPVVQGGEGAG